MHELENCVDLKMGMNERINDCVLPQFGCIERMENSRIAKRVTVGECMGSHPVYSVNGCIKNKVCMQGKQGNWCMNDENE